MLAWGVVFLLIAIVAGIFGFGGIAGTATMFAKIIFVAAVVLFVLSFIAGRRGASKL